MNATEPKILTPAEMTASDFDMLERSGFNEDLPGSGSYSLYGVIDPTLSAHVRKYGESWGFTVWSEDVCLGARNPEWSACAAAAQAFGAMAEIIRGR